MATTATNYADPMTGSAVIAATLGGPEILILVALAVLVFGAGWLPKAARNLGKAKVEFDDAAKQFNDAKNSVVEASGVKEIEATMRKANQVLNTSPQNMLKNAAKSAATGSAAKAAKAADDGIEDAEIVDRSPAAESKDQSTPAPGTDDDPDGSTINVNL